MRIAPEWDGTPQMTWVELFGNSSFRKIQSIAIEGNKAPEIQKSKDDNFHKDNQSCATCSEIVDAMLSQSAANQENQTKMYLNNLIII